MKYLLGFLLGMLFFPALGADSKQEIAAHAKKDYQQALRECATMKGQKQADCRKRARANVNTVLRFTGDPEIEAVAAAPAKVKK